MRFRGETGKILGAHAHAYALVGGCQIFHAASGKGLHSPMRSVFGRGMRAGTGKKKEISPTGGEELVRAKKSVRDSQVVLPEAKAPGTSTGKRGGRKDRKVAGASEKDRFSIPSRQTHFSDNSEKQTCDKKGGKKRRGAESTDTRTNR